MVQNQATLGHPTSIFVVSDLSQLQGDLTPSHSSAFLPMDKGFGDPITSALHSLVLDFTHVDCLVS